jgi:uncharacterized membrane protein
MSNKRRLRKILEAVVLLIFIASILIFDPMWKTGIHPTTFAFIPLLIIIVYWLIKKKGINKTEDQENDKNSQEKSEDEK